MHQKSLLGLLISSKNKNRVLSRIYFIKEGPHVRELRFSNSFKSVEGSVSWIGAFWNDPIGVIRCSRVLAIKSRPAKTVLNFVTWIVQKKSSMSNWAYKKTLSLFCRPYYQQGHLVHISYQPASNRGYITYWWMVWKVCKVSHTLILPLFPSERLSKITVRPELSK